MKFEMTTIDEGIGGAARLSLRCIGCSSVFAIEMSERALLLSEVRQRETGQLIVRAQEHACPAATPPVAAERAKGGE